MDVGTGRSGEGMFPPVPQQVQAGFGADCSTVRPPTEESLLHTRKPQQNVSVTDHLGSLALAGVVGLKHG